MRCTSLVSITISTGVTKIGTCAFALNGITSLTIPTSVTSLGIHNHDYHIIAVIIIVGVSIFAGANSLVTIVAPSSLTIEAPSLSACQQLIKGIIITAKIKIVLLSLL